MPTFLEYPGPYVTSPMLHPQLPVLNQSYGNMPIGRIGHVSD